MIKLSINNFNYKSVSRKPILKHYKILIFFGAKF